MKSGTEDSLFSGLMQYMKKNILIIIISLFFGAWMIFLIVDAFIAERSVQFYDVLNQVELNSQYSSDVPILRYFIEPLIGTVFSVGYYAYNWYGLFLIIYPIVRLFFLMIDKYRYEWRIRNHPYINALKKSLDFFFLVTILTLIVIIIILFSKYPLEGFMRVANNYSLLLQYAISISIISFSLKFIYEINRIHHPSSLPRRENKIDRFFKVFARKGNIQRIFSKISHFFVNEIGLFIKLLIFFIIIDASLISINLPTQVISTDLNSDEFLFDFHVHTLASDGFLSPEERVKWYMDQGIQGAAFADHHNTYGSKSAQEYVEQNNLNFTVFMAQEYTHDDIHLNIFGIEENIIPDYYITPDDAIGLNVSEMIQYVKTNGGYVTVNHYRWPPSEIYSYENLRDWGVDGFEIANDGNIYPSQIRQFCLDNNLACMGGSDIHNNKPLNTFVRLRLPDPSNTSLDYIFQELKKNTHQVVIVEQYEEKITFNQFEQEDLENFINYLFGLDSFQVVSWVLWSYGIWVFIIWMYKKIQNVKLQDYNILYS